MTCATSDLLTELAGFRLEHRILSGAGHESVVRDRRLVSLPQSRKPGLVEGQHGRKQVRQNSRAKSGSEFQDNQTRRVGGRQGLNREGRWRNTGKSCMRRRRTISVTVKLGLKYCD